VQESQFSLGLGAMPLLSGLRSGSVPGPVPENVPSKVPESLGLLSLTPFQREVMIALTQGARRATRRK
jgi:hypothetical protein